METLIWSFGFIGLIWALLYFRSSLIISTVAIGAFLLTFSKISGASSILIVFSWIVFIAIAGFLNIGSLRRMWFSNKALNLFRGIMPKMSQTERDALEAGSVWWDGDLFSGKPDWDKFLQIPISKLSKAEQDFLDGPTNQLCAMIDDWKITQHEYDLPEEVWNFMKQNGFFGMIIPKKYGGLEFSAQAHSAVVVKIAGRSITAAVTVMVPNSLGPAELLLRYGTDEQKNHYLEKLAKGIEIPCFALTSPEAGSDAASMVDTGIVCRGEFEGKKDVLGIRLNWEKRYITLGPVSTVLGLAFKLYDPDQLIGDTEELGITCALIPTDTKGVEIGSRHFPLNSAFQNGPNSGKDVFIPIDWIIGGQAQAGRGWRMLMECLAAGRSISLPALGTGAGKLVSRATGAYSRVRQQFKMPIGQFEGVEEVLARIAALTYMVDATRSLTATAIDLGESPSVISAIIKYNATETMRTLVNDGMDIQGGSGICLGPRNLLGRIYQSIPISITVEGANILTRSLIIFGQGAIRCHPYVFTEMQAAVENDKDKAELMFDKALFAHFGFAMSNAARALILGLTRSRLVRSPAKGPHAIYFKHLTRFSSAFALVSDIALLVLGGSLKRKEKLSGRLADVLSHLYLASATLKRFEDQGCPKEDVPLMQWACEYSLRHIQQSLDKFIINFPNRWIAWFLRKLIFPTGKTYSGPTDKLGHKVAAILLSPSAARDRLTQGMYLPDYNDGQNEEALAKLEYALSCVVEASPIERALRAAVKHGRLNKHNREELINSAIENKIISEKEAEILNRADAARNDAVQVDEFSKDELVPACSPKTTKECA